MARLPLAHWFTCLSLLLMTCVLSGCAHYGYYTLPKSEYEAATKDLTEDERQRIEESGEIRQSIRPCTALTDFSQEAELSAACTLSIIEFDDQGEFWWAEQLDNTLDLIEKKSHRDKKGNSNSEALVVVFVHGWKNNASLNNEIEKNLAGFKKVLIQLTREEDRRGEEGRAVIGVYMSWHGLSVKGKLLKQVSFFARKNAATRVARVSFSHAIHRIVARTKGTFVDCPGECSRHPDDRPICPGNPDSVAVVVGHSFGGLIVENTLLRTLTVETNDFDAYGADLTVLVNPASEATLARQSVQSLKKAPPKRLQIGEHDIAAPLIVSVTSVADKATGPIFYLGMTFKGLFKNLFRKYENDEPGRQKQRYYYRHTPGHSCEYDEPDCPSAALYSHNVPCPEGEECKKLKKDTDAMDEKQALSQQNAAGKTIFPPPAVQVGNCIRDKDKSEADLDCIENLSFYGAATDRMYTVHRDAQSNNQTGYWIMPIPASIVGNHSDIFQSELASLLAAFINLKLAHIVDSTAEAESYMQQMVPN